LFSFNPFKDAGISGFSLQAKINNKMLHYTANTNIERFIYSIGMLSFGMKGGIKNPKLTPKELL